MLGSFFWLVKFWRFLQSEESSSRAAKWGNFCFNPAGWLADRRVACAVPRCPWTHKPCLVFFVTKPLVQNYAFWLILSLSVWYCRVVILCH
jgi:hypothetical protein